MSFGKLEKTVEQGSKPEPNPIPKTPQKGIPLKKPEKK